MSNRGWMRPAHRAPRARYLLGLVALLAAAPAPALDSVTLQLKWRHQFQFAGYYIAKAKGYYRDAGFDVRIREADPRTDVVAEVVSGTAQFGVGSSALVLSRRTQPVVALAPIYQHSAFGLLVRADRAGNLHELVGQAIMLEADASEILGLFQKEGIAPERLDIRPHSLGVEALIQNQVAAISAYSTTEPYLLREAGIPVNEFSARAAGIDFYGDILFTSESELRAHPRRVRAFLDASLKGWRYAMEHVEESIAVIMADYNSQQHGPDYYRFEAEETRRLMQPDLVEIGHSNPGRWRHIADTYAALGMLPAGFSLNGFLYQAEEVRLDPRLVAALTGATGVALLLAILSWFVFSLNRRLRAEIAQREGIHRKLAESEALHRLLTENCGDVIWMFDLDSQRFEYVSPSVERLRGFTSEEVMSQPMEASLTTESALKIRAFISESSARLRAGDQEARYAITEIEQPCKGGGTVKTEVVTSYLMDEQGQQPSKLLGITRDISLRKALEAELRTRLAAIEAAGDAILITDPQGYLLYANPMFTQQTGYDLTRDPGMHTRALNSGQHGPEYYATLWRTVLEGRVWRGELVNRRKNGELYEEEMTISPVKDEGGEIACFVAVQRDVSEQRAMERALKAANERLQEHLEKISRLRRELAEQAIRDPLTGLYNRRYLDETLAREFARASHEGYGLTVAMIDMDHFKRINDQWGHPIGDEVLKALARCLQDAFREGDIVCRYGGEEFLLLLPHLPPAMRLERIETIRLRFAEQALQIRDVRIHATLSVGLASFPEHARTPQALIEQADAALYQAKHLGRNRTEIAPELGLSVLS